MSLHALANHMAAQGRNGDSVLVHMTPKEVGGLHALAIANGGQLTINPETGLPEASFLGDLLPAVLGFGLDMFLPGLGEAVGGAFGLSAAAGTGIAVGGLTGLATGNLSKGVMAGFGAYGGAGLAEGLMGAGANAATNAGTAGWENTLAERGLTPGTPEYGAAASDLALGAQKTALAASPMDKLTAGFSATTQNPNTLLDYAKGNGKYLLAAGVPSFGGFSEEDQTVTKMPSTGMINPFIMNRKAVPRDYSLSPSAQQRYFNYEVTPITPVHAANGGAVKTFGEGGGIGGGDNNMRGGGGDEGNGLAATDPYTQQFLDKARTYENTMTNDSARAFDYLMGNPQPTAQTTGRTGRTGSTGSTGRLPTVKMPFIPQKTEGIQALANVVRGTGGSGGSGDARGISSTTAAGDVNSYTNGALPAILGLQAVPAPVISLSDSGYATAAQAESAQNRALAAQYGMYGNPNAVAGPMSSIGVGFGSQGQHAENAPAFGVGYGSQGQHAEGNTSDGSGDGKSARDGSGFGGTGSGTGGDGGGVGRGAGGADSGGSHGAGGPGDARGGYLAHGQFDQRPRYADGGYTNTMTDDSARAFDYLMGNAQDYSISKAKAAEAVKMPVVTQATPRTTLSDEVLPTRTVDTVNRTTVGGGGGISTLPRASDTGGTDFGVTGQPSGAVFNINDFDTNSSNSDFGVGNQPAGTTFDINDFDNNTSAGTVDNSVNDFGFGNQPAGTTFDINDFNNNTSAGTVNTGDTGLYTGSSDEGMNNVDTSNPEIFAQEYVDPRENASQKNQDRLDQQEMTESYFGGNVGSDFGGNSDSGNDFGNGSYTDGSFGNGYSDSGSDFDFGNSYGGGGFRDDFYNMSSYADGGMTGMADGGLGSLGGYSDGGRLLRGPGDGVSDSIPATIGQHQPARLADGEFVVPARIVSELGNGSTEAGARQLYAMMDRIQSGRKKTVGKNKVAANTRAAKHLPA